MSTIILKDLEGVISLPVSEVVSKYPLIGKGNSRRVYDLQNGYVVKVTDKGLEQDNKKEWSVWRNSSETQKEFLTPCLLDSVYHQKLYMPLAEKVPFTDLTFQPFFHEKLGLLKFNTLMNVLYELAEQHNLHYFDLFLPSNWGKFGDQYKLIDFGLQYDDSDED